MTAATHSSWGRWSPYARSRSFSRTAYMTRADNERDPEETEKMPMSDVITPRSDPGTE
jgi:hypothetical protein